MQGLRGQRDLLWIQRILTLFADDLAACWLIKSKADFLQMKRDVELLLEILQIFKLTVNLKKTAFLLRLEGKDSTHILRDHVFQEEGKQFLQISVFGTTQALQIKASHEYLGTKIAYKNRLDLNTAHRLEAAQHKYRLIRKVLNGKGPLKAGGKIRLWQACICTSLMYSLEVVGLTASGARQIQVLANRHIRAILRQPPHLTHLSTADLWTAAKLETPGHQLVQRLANLCLRRDPRQAPDGPDIISNDQVHARLQLLLETLRQLILQAPTDTEPTEQPVAGHACPHCDSILVSAHALSIHLALHHQDQPKPARQAHVFRAEAHSIGGMPTCKLCLRNFVKWRQLRLHIEKGSCPHLGGSSFLLSPMAPDNHLLRRLEPELPETSQQAPTAEPPQNFPDALPLVLDPAFHAKFDTWDRLLAHPQTKARLKHHCVICNMWIMDYRHIRQHYNKAHHPHHPTVLKEALALSYSYKSHLTRGHTCRWCGHSVGAPGRHSTQCVVLNQLAIAVCYCRQQLHVTQDVAGSTGSGHLPALHAVREGTAVAVTPKEEDTRSPAPFPNKRQRPSWPTSRRMGNGPPMYTAHHMSPPSLQDPMVHTMGKLLLKHEEFLSFLRKDMAYVLFFRQDQLPNLMEVSKANKEKTAAGSTEVHSPLRTLLLNCLLKELLQRTQKVAATAEGRSSLQQPQWMNSGGHWNYMRWNSQQRCLVPDTRREPLTHENAEEGHQQATFSLVISLRHPAAADVYSSFGILQGNALTSLVGMSMKKDDLPQQHLAKLLNQEVYRRRAGLP
eukprot:s968_g16.t1